MDNQKNIIAAIALSSAILVLWALFFSPDQPTKEQLLAEKEKVENTETPKIEKTEITRISRIVDNGKDCFSSSLQVKRRPILD